MNQNIINQLPELQHFSGCKRSIQAVVSPPDKLGNLPLHSTRSRLSPEPLVFAALRLNGASCLPSNLAVD